MARAIAVIGVTWLVIGITSSTPSAADSPWIHSTSNDCAAQWDASENRFWLHDKDYLDGKGCAVLYSFKPDHTPSSWIWMDDSPTGVVTGYGVSNPDGDKFVYSKVCDHRSRDVRNCTVWQGTAS